MAVDTLLLPPEVDSHRNTNSISHKRHAQRHQNVSKLNEPVFTTRLSATVTVHNLNRAFNALLDELDLKTGADGRTRTLYSWRHFYATQDLERGVSTHALSRQLGNSTEMIDRHYSKYSPLLNAELHSGRKRKH